LPAVASTDFPPLLVPPLALAHNLSLFEQFDLKIVNHRKFGNQQPSFPGQNTPLGPLISRSWSLMPLRMQAYSSLSAKSARDRRSHTSILFGKSVPLAPPPESQSGSKASPKEANGERIDEVAPDERLLVGSLGACVGAVVNIMRVR